MDGPDKKLTHAATGPDYGLDGEPTSLETFHSVVRNDPVAKHVYECARNIDMPEVHMLRWMVFELSRSKLDVQGELVRLMENGPPPVIIFDKSGGK